MQRLCPQIDYAVLNRSWLLDAKCRNKNPPKSSGNCFGLTKNSKISAGQGAGQFENEYLFDSGCTLTLRRINIH